MKVHLRSAAAISACILLAGLIFLGCSSPAKPEKDGKGPLAIVISGNVGTPEFHNPLELWKRRHMDFLTNGEFSQRECVSCHELEKSCNNCHSYVGVKLVEAPVDPGFIPGENRFGDLIAGKKSSN